MSHDLERALADLADAAERSARHGILAESALPLTLHRVIGRVRRRRAARAATAGAVALVVLVGGAGAVDYSLDHGRHTLPAVPVPSDPPTRTEFCGVPEAALERIAGADDTIDFENLTAAVAPAADPFHFVARGVSNRTDPLVLGADRDGADTVLLTRDGVVVGAGSVASPVRDHSTTVPPGGAIAWDGPAVVYDCARLDGVTRAGAGDYVMWLVSDLSVDGSPLRVAGGPWRITLSDPPVTPGPTAQPDPTTCGVSDESLSTLADPFRYDVPLGFTAPTPSAGAVDATPDLVATLSAKAEETPQIVQLLPYVVVVRDHVVVGGSPLDRTGPDPTARGDYGTFTPTGPLRACPPGTGADPRTLDPSLLAPGTYGVWVVAKMRFAGASDEVVAIGGPWELTLTEASTDPVRAMFSCGATLAFAAESLPAAGGLTLTAELPATGWQTPGTGPSWSATLGTDAGQTILANVGTSAHIAFTDDQWVVVGRTFSGDGTVDLFAAGPGATTGLSGATDVAGCRPDGELAGVDGSSLAPGTYWAWPFVTAVLKEVQPADGEAYSPPADPVVVVGAPSRVTFAD